MPGLLGQSLWAHLRLLAAHFFVCFGTVGKAADDPCTVGRECLFIYFFFNQVLPTVTWTCGCVPVQLLSSSWMRFFFFHFKIHFS